MAGLRSPRGAKKSTRRNYSNAHVRRSRKARGSAIKRAAFTLLVLAALGVAVGFLMFRSTNGVSIFENAVGTVLSLIHI